LSGTGRARNWGGRGHSSAPPSDLARDDYRIMRFGGRPVLAVPALSFRSKLAGLSRYQPISWKRTWFRRAALLAISLRLDGLLGPRRPTPFATDEDFGFLSWLERARIMLNAPDALAAVIWPPEIHRKRLYVHLMNGSGVPIAFCKLALDAASGMSLADEIETLVSLGKLGLRAARVPRVLLHEEFAGRRYVAYEPLPSQTESVDLPWDDLAGVAKEFSGESRRIGAEALAQQDWWRRFRAQRDAFPKDFLDALEVAARRGVAVCRIHGDFTPANMFRADGVIWLCDWEFSSESGPRKADEIAYRLAQRHAFGLSHPDEALGELLHPPGSKDKREDTDEIAMALAFLAGRGDGVAKALAAQWPGVTP